jgi:hypothetical protein
MVMRQPIGVCAAIAPFNFPARVPLWFLPFAVVSGNTFILKPSEQVPLSMKPMFELLAQCDLPPGVANLVQGGRDSQAGPLDFGDFVACLHQAERVRDDLILRAVVTLVDLSADQRLETLGNGDIHVRRSTDDDSMSRSIRPVAPLTPSEAQRGGQRTTRDGLGRAQRQALRSRAPARKDPTRRSGRWQGPPSWRAGLCQESIGGSRRGGHPVLRLISA